MLLPLALALLVGSVAQVALGRTDLRRAHRALSLGFWAVTFVTLIVAAGYWHFIRSTGPDAVSVHGVSRDASGRWIYVEGNGRHSGWYPHRFLIDTTTGRYLPHPGPEDGLDRIGFRMLFSADGRFGALPGAARGGAALTLFDLREAEPRVTQVALESSPPPSWKTSFALSPTAATVFVAHESGASLFELPSGRRIATTTVPPGWRPAVACYLAEGKTRAWLVPSDDGPARDRRAEMRVLDLAADGASSAVTFPVAAAVDPVVGWRAVHADARGERIVTSEAGLQLRDGTSGAPLASLVEGAGDSPFLFLADGRIVVEGRAAAGQPRFTHPRLWVFDRLGTKLADFELPLASPGSLGLGPEVAHGRVVVSSYRGVLLSEDALVVDVGERTSRRQAPAWAQARVRLAPGRLVGGPRGGFERALLQRRRRAWRGSPGTAPEPPGPDRLRDRRAKGRGRGRSAARRADQRALSVWIITSRARPDASARSAVSGSVSRRNAASSAARSRGASPATRIGGRTPPRTITCEAARRETRPFASSNGRISTRRASATAAA